ncbi:hypothetical protein ISS37_02200 [candidate division KSB1 bacterium]|nr:hypothetical protein [candidate division KSB1 bacterium]
MKKTIRNMALFFTGIIGLILLYSCTPKAPQAPKWETSYTLSLGGRLYKMSEIIDNTNIIDSTYNDDIRLLTFLFDQEIEPFELEENFNLEDVVISYNFGMDEISIETPGSIRMPYLPSPVYPPQYTFPYTGVVDSQMIIDTLFNLSPLERVNKLVVTNGYIDFQIDNNLSFSLSSDSIDSLKYKIILIETTNGQLIDSVIFDEIDPDNSALVRMDLAGDTLYHQMAFKIMGGTEGSKGQIMTIPGLEYYTLSIEFSPQFTSDWAEMRPPPMSFSQRTSLDIQEAGEIEIQSIDTCKVDSGLVIITVENNMNLEAELLLTFPEIYVDSITWSVKMDTIIMAPKETVIDSVNLNNHFMTPTNGRLLSFLVDGTTQELPPDSFVVVTNTDSINIEVRIKVLIFEWVTGVLDRTEIEIPSTAQGFEVFPEELENIELGKVYLQLALDNTIERIPMELGFTVQAFRTGGDTAQVEVNKTITGDDTLSVPNAEVLINVLPDSVKIINGQAYIGNGLIRGTIYVGNSMTGTMSVIAPFIFKMGPSELPIEPPTKVSKLGEMVESLSITGRVENRIPIGGKIYVLFSENESFLKDTVVVDSVDTLMTITLPMPIIGPDSLTQTASVDTSIELTPEEFARFQEQDNYIKQIIALEGTVIRDSVTGVPIDTVMVKVQSSDYLAAYLTARVTVKYDF